MNRSQTKILVESWRDYMGARTASNKDTTKSSEDFVKIVKDYTESFKKMDPNNQSLGNNQSIRSNKTYRNLWNSFWGTFSTKNAKKHKDMCVWSFFDHLKRTCQSGESKHMFDNAFKVLLHVSGAGFATKLIEMLFNDYMSNMRGRGEGYCWETDEEGFHLYSEFQDKLKDLKSQGFDLKTGECHYLKS